MSEDGKVWVASYDEGLLTVMDPTTLEATTYEVGHGLAGIATATDAVWIVETLDGTVSSIDPSSGTIRRGSRLGGAPKGIELGGGYIWVSRPA